MNPVSFDDVLQARERINGVAHRTPIFTSTTFNAKTGCNVYFKAENLQRGGAFKFRGAYNKISSLTDDERHRGVLAYSSGNHAQAVALTAKLFGIKAVIVMPQDAPEIKIKATREYGAEIVFYDRYKESREDTGSRVAKELGLTLVPPFDDYKIIAGQGTAALELMEDITDLDFLLTPCSGGGLLAGCSIAAKHLNPDIRIFGVEPELGNDTFQSFQKGERVKIDVPDTIADGLASPSPGALTFPILQKNVEAILLVSETEMLQTVRFILQRMKLLVEPSGAAAAAAVLYKKFDFTGKNIGVILSGGNADIDKVLSFKL